MWGDGVVVKLNICWCFPFHSWIKQIIHLTFVTDLNKPGPTGSINQEHNKEWEPKVCTSLVAPVLLDVQVPVPGQVIGLVIVCEVGLDVVAATDHHAFGRFLYGADELVFLSVGGVAAHHEHRPVHWKHTPNTQPCIRLVYWNRTHNHVSNHTHNHVSCEPIQVTGRVRIQGTGLDMWTHTDDR